MWIELGGLQLLPRASDHRPEIWSLRPDCRRRHASHYAIDAVRPLETTQKAVLAALARADHARCRRIQKRIRERPA